ncbi:symmetrical bis(5'-nucleosyl)-tetraphosphatase [Pseudidiomarina sp.]|uniref:symmetrical bis(5'-nucleosyl)-tetraphosphatase n=1 Tax=Pseudidiomarina sp. TaxID=2081707 RepID=UPI00299DBE86|nr:symmetrical bis(5'-nucleosyl)-tetraphosphatase [Pseudidiomarina sp.]MDX1706604.1 symmetrical bis(5'-nucleosyl)-tetraphosphatase [Pseudidiomarina sp.]
MTRYIVGDVQGCANELQQLLDKVSFNPNYDELWCVGDIVARGPESLKALQLIRSLGKAASCVLGNHDLNLLAVLCGVRKANPADKLDAILALGEDDKRELIRWFCQQPLLRASHDLVMTHAGIYPWWSLTEATNYAGEVSAQLRTACADDHLAEWLSEMYGNEPARWSDELRGADRTRFIINALTRMRFCHHDGRLNFDAKGAPKTASDSDLVPWFELAPVTDKTLVFGHWAALEGQTARDDVIGLDTGCVWGNEMTLLSWPDGRRYTQPARPELGPD